MKIAVQNAVRLFEIYAVGVMKVLPLSVRLSFHRL